MLNELWLLNRRSDQGLGSSGGQIAVGFNEIVRRKLGNIASALNLVMPGSKFEEPRIANNVSLFAPGEYGGISMTKVMSEAHAISPGTFFRKHADISANVVVDGLTLASEDELGCVTVRAGYTAVFRGCTFERPSESTSHMVLVEAGARAIMLGCVFRGSGVTSLPMVSHTGAAADVQIAFCYNRTGNTLFTPGTATGTGNL
tara:strand:+ start:18029 stop:18634 length:606 start_codon:yes stop_codon:yes gene_type:complete